MILLIKKNQKIRSFYQRVNSINLFVLLICILVSTSVYSQTTEKKLLLEVLISLEKTHNYTFTYADEVITGVYVTFPNEELTFKEKIKDLGRQTGLLFQFLENNFVAIRTQNSLYTLCGYIFDVETKEPLIGVTLKGHNSYSITDAKGYFELKTSNSSESIEVRYFGYKSIKNNSSEFSSKECQNIYLVPSNELLSEIILNNYLIEGIDKVADGSIDINYNNFGILPGLIETDVLQTVQALPGIQSLNETVSDINIRGGTHDQNLILWDNIKMYQSGHFFGLISIFNPRSTKNTTLIKNGTSTDYTDGVSGTIDIKTDSKINDTISGSIGINFINADAFIDIPFGERSSLQLTARKAINNLIETPTYTSYFERISQDSEADNLLNSSKEFDFYDTSIRWLYKISDQDFIKLSALHVNNELQFNENAIINQVEESKQSSLEQSSYAAGLTYKRKWNSNFSTTLNIYESDYILDALNSDIINQRLLEQRNKVSETSIKLSSLFNFNDRFSSLNGFQYTDTGITNFTKLDFPIVNQTATEVIREYSLYTQLNFSSNSGNSHIKAGVRYNFIEQFNKHIFEPRLSINHELFNNFTIELLGEFKHQNTSQIINFQNDFLGIEKRRWQLSNNEDIPILESKQASVGLNYNNKGWLISFESYIKKVEGITTQSQGFLNQYAFTKADGSYDIIGLDFLINKKLQKFSTWFSYSYAQNEYTFEELDEIIFPSNLDMRHSVTVGSAYNTKSLKVSAGLNWHSGRPTTMPVKGDEITQENTINYERANSSNINDYFRIDMSVMYTFNILKNIKAEAGLAIWNAFNKNNEINNYYRLENFEIKEVSNVALELTPNFSFRIEF